MQTRGDVNRVTEQRKQPTDLLPVDPRERLLGERIEHAKQRLADDLDQAFSMIRETAKGAGRGLARLVIVGGLVVVGLVVALVQRRQRKRLRVVWK